MQTWGGEKNSFQQKSPPSLPQGKIRKWLAPFANIFIYSKAKIELLQCILIQLHHPYLYSSVNHSQCHIWCWHFNHGYFRCCHLQKHGYKNFKTFWYLDIIVIKLNLFSISQKIKHSTGYLYKYLTTFYWMYKLKRF